jgi:hypothetical protein
MYMGGGCSRPSLPNRCHLARSVDRRQAAEYGLANGSEQNGVSSLDLIPSLKQAHYRLVLPLP